MAAEWAQHTHGVQGTILFISEVKLGDMIVHLEGQADLGNSMPLEITRVQPRGTTQIEYDYIWRYSTQLSATRTKRVHKNTLVLVVGAASHSNIDAEREAVTQ